MEQKDLQELDLEDILKEFSKPEEDPELPGQEEVTGDTIRLDKIQKAVRSAPIKDHTAVFTPVQEPQAPARAPASFDDTGVFTPITQEQWYQYGPDKPEPEPFSESWEPEYEAPMGEYSAPIVFKPKTRLQQLRAKLVAGPEKRYYELSEQGFGKLQAGIVLSLLIFLVAAASVVLFEVGLIPSQRVRLVVFLQLLTLLLAGLVGCYRMLDGMADLLHLKFSLNTLLCFTFVVCCADGIVCLSQQRLGCSTLFCLEVFLSQLAALQRRRTHISQMDTLRKAPELQAVVRHKGYWDKLTGVSFAPGEPESFMDNYEAPSTPEKFLQLFALIGLLASIALGILAGLREDFAAGVRACAAALLICMPATAFISMTRPVDILQKRMHKLGTVLCGWQGVRAVPKKLIFPLEHKDLVPKSLIKLNGIKFYGDIHPDLVVAYAASLAEADGGSLCPILHQQLTGRNVQCQPVEDFHEFSGGISGVVDGLPMCMGTVDFMKRMEVTFPEGKKPPNAVCLAIDGKLAALFAVSYGHSKSAQAGLKTLCGYKDITPVLIHSDFMLTPGFLARHFPMNTEKLVLPEREEREALASQKSPEDGTVIALATREGLAQKAFAVTGSRVLCSSLRLGALIHMLGGALGLVITAVLILTGSIALLTPARLLLYSLLWMIPGWLITQWTRSV